MDQERCAAVPVAAAVLDGGVDEEKKKKKSSSDGGDDDDDDSKDQHTKRTADGDVERGDGAGTAADKEEEPYSVHGAWAKAGIIALAASGSFFSPLSANIYFAALDPLAAELRVSQGLINLSLTTYLIMQGVAPAFVGDFADTAGRRPAYLACFVVYICANAGLGAQGSFGALLALRCVQSAGISSTIALGFGVAADVATSAERGTYVGWMTSGLLVGSAVGPVLGSLFAQFLGWRWIFWFLTILASAALVVLALAFPETGRNIVGNGSRPPQRWNRTPVSVLRGRWAERRRRQRSQPQGGDGNEARARRPKLRMPNPVACLRCVGEKDVGLLLLFNSLVYTAFYDVTASVPYLFQQAYGFDDLQIGLSFLPYGAGVMIAPSLSGRLMDWNFRRIARREGVAIAKGRTTALDGFPIEEARAWIVLPMVVTGSAAILAYGWAMEANAPLAAPLVLLFLIGLLVSGGFGATGVMLVDYYPESPATATAANNLVRCLMGAAGTSVIVYMIDGMGRGWCFTLIAAVSALTSVTIMATLLRWGPAWREQRRVRLAARRQRDEASSQAP